MGNIEFVDIGDVKIAAHKEPKAVIQFLGSFIFGSFPVCSYRQLLEHLWELGYTLIVHEFPFSLGNVDHWGEAVKLQARSYDAILHLVKESHKNKEQQDFYLSSSNYRWLGHSLGCKYILLLELMSDSTDDQVIEAIADCLSPDQRKVVEKDLDEINGKRFDTEKALAEVTGHPVTLDRIIRNQRTVLMAPEYRTTASILNINIPVGNPFEKPFPDGEKTIEMIENNLEIFNLSGLISFSFDAIAKDDVADLERELSRRYPGQEEQLHRGFFGGHFSPQGNQYQEIAAAALDIYGQFG